MPWYYFLPQAYMPGHFSHYIRSRELQETWYRYPGNPILLHHQFREEKKIRNYLMHNNVPSGPRYYWAFLKRKVTQAGSCKDYPDPGRFALQFLTAGHVWLVAGPLQADRKIRDYHRSIPCRGQKKQLYSSLANQ